MIIVISNNMFTVNSLLIFFFIISVEFAIDFIFFLHTHNWLGSKQQQINLYILKKCLKWFYFLLRLFYKTKNQNKIHK